MRKIYILLLLTAAFLQGYPCQAQLSGSDSLQAKLTSIFYNVDKSQVPTGYLYEAGVRLLDMRYYNGTLSDSNRTDMDVLRYLRLILRSARVYGTDTLPSLKTYNARLAAADAASSGVIPISMQYMQYASIASDAVARNLLYVKNEQVFDVARRSRNPYRTNVLFAAAPTSSFSLTNTASFVFRRNLYLTNSSVPTYAPQIDFGDGRGYQTASWDQPISVTYSTIGIKRIKVKLPFIYSNGTQESWFDFNVLSVVEQARTNNIVDLEQIFFSNGSHSGGRAKIIFGSTNGIKHTKLTKPFIISEGYNLYDIAPKLRKCNNPNNDIAEFFEKIDQPFYSNISSFRTSLLNAGYDIVYIDNARGTDDIRRNAQLFEDVVRWVNQNKEGGKVTGERNVVMGQSMGGLVSRYGLAEMVKRGNDDPHTRLLILHDSPQRGAYNPVGVQSLGRSFDVPFLFGNSMADLNGQIEATVKVLNEPATQQLSILNAFNGRNDIRANTFIPEIYQPMISFSGQAPYDVVAVSNGSQCGKPQNTPVGVVLAKSDLALLVPVSYVGIAGVTGEFASYGLPAYGQQATVSRVDVRLEYQLRIGACPFCVSIPIRFKLLRESQTSPPNTLPYETLPGGSTNPAQQAGSCAEGFDFGSLKGIYSAYLRTSLYNGDICFVPNYSALDVATVTPSTVLAKYVNSYTDNPSLPRVSRYIAQEQTGSSLTNTAHISFTPRNAEWIFSQMQGTVLPCNAAGNECTVTNRITGPNAICPGQQATFGIQNIPPGVSVQWSISPAGTVTPLNGTTGSTFTIFAPFSSSGAVIILQAQLSNCSPPITLAVPINNGYVDTQLDLQGAQKVCPYTTAVVRVEGVNVSPPYYWTETRYRNGTPILTGSFTTQIPEYAVSVDEETVEVSVTAASVCTGTNVTASTRTITPYIDPNGGFYCDPTTFRIAPNPADAYVEISTRPTNTPAPTPPAGHANPHAFKAQLHDGNGKVVGTAETQVGLTRLTTATLPAGLYHLVIQRGSKVVRRNIRIQH